MGERARGPVSPGFGKARNQDVAVRYLVLGRSESSQCSGKCYRMSQGSPLEPPQSTWHRIHFMPFNLILQGVQVPPCYILLPLEACPQRHQGRTIRVSTERSSTSTFALRQGTSKALPSSFPTVNSPAARIQHCRHCLTTSSNISRHTAAADQALASPRISSNSSLYVSAPRSDLSSVAGTHLSCAVEYPSQWTKIWRTLRRP